MLKIEDLCYEYESGFQLKNINLEVKGGESIGIIGENGSGKTTLAKMLNGLLKPTKGTVEINGINTTKTSVETLSKYVGYVF
ncbi:MAG: ATP-binding cassette domain-containing protein, partial [Methanomicrobia archaeon]|nr:ATP-binding cassette domain-containing protein [Methanomicrobia archaeon]